MVWGSLETRRDILVIKVLLLRSANYWSDFIISGNWIVLPCHLSVRYMCFMKCKAVLTENSPSNQPWVGHEDSHCRWTMILMRSIYQNDAAICPFWHQNLNNSSVLLGFWWLMIWHLDFSYEHNKTVWCFKVWTVFMNFLLCSEEIAFYNGNLREKQTIHATFKKLVGNRVLSQTSVFTCGPKLLLMQIVIIVTLADIGPFIFSVFFCRWIICTTSSSFGFPWDLWTAS